MRARRSWTLRLAVLFAGSAVSGCGGTMSLDMNYSPALYRLQQADQWRGIALGVAKLEDRRSWIDPTNPESLGYVMQQGAFRFGLTYDGRKYVPVSDLVQTLFVEEFTRAGVEAKAIPKILTKDNVADTVEAGSQVGTAYVLGGRVPVFEIVNEMGVWTGTSPGLRWKTSTATAPPARKRPARSTGSSSPSNTGPACVGAGGPALRNKSHRRRAGIVESNNRRRTRDREAARAGS